MNPVKLVRGDKATLRYQLKQDGDALDITGMSFKLAVKERLSDTTHRISPVTGTVDDALNGKFSFLLTDAETAQSPFAGQMEIAMYDSEGDKTTLTPAGGLSFRLVEDVVG